MNYLAHAHLSEQSAAGLAGALAGDFIKGRLSTGLEPTFARSVRLHRLLDSYSDAHPVHLASRNRISGRRRRFAGIIVDMAYDHFLACEWARYSDESLTTFTGRVYGALATQAHDLPPRLRMIAPRMAKQDWLGSYESLDAVGRALDGISQRFKRETPLPGALEEIRASYDALGEDFRQFYAQIAQHADGLRQSLAGVDASAASHGPNASSS